MELCVLARVGGISAASLLAEGLLLRAEHPQPTSPAILARLNRRLRRQSCCLFDPQIQLLAAPPTYAETIHADLKRRMPRLIIICRLLFCNVYFDNRCQPFQETVRVSTAIDANQQKYVDRFTKEADTLIRA